MFPPGTLKAQIRAGLAVSSLVGIGAETNPIPGWFCIPLEVDLGQKVQKSWEHWLTRNEPKGLPLGQRHLFPAKTNLPYWSNLCTHLQAKDLEAVDPGAGIMIGQ